MNKIQKFFSVVFFIAIFVVLIYLIQNYGIEPLRNKIESMGIWAPFGIFILRGVSIILPALPSSAYSLLAGSLLGFQKGYMTIIFSDIVFCQAAFFIARNYGRVPVRNLVGPKAMQKIESFNQNLCCPGKTVYFSGKSLVWISRCGKHYFLPNLNPGEVLFFYSDFYFNTINIDNVK